MKQLLLFVLLAGGVAVVPVASAAETAAKAAAETDVTGIWDLVVETSQGSGTPVFTLKQDGEKLTGRYRGQFGEAPVTGTIKGNAIAFAVTVNSGEELKIEYIGTVDGSGMKGTAKFGSYGDGTFTGKKRAK